MISMPYSECCSEPFSYAAIHLDCTCSCSMVRTRFALILYFRMVAHKAACYTLSKAFFEISEDMVQILLVLEVLFTQDSEVEDLFCCASSRSESSLIFRNYFFSLGFRPVQDNFQHDFA